MNWCDIELQPINYNIIPLSKYTVAQQNAIKLFCKKEINSVCIYCGGSYTHIRKCVYIDNTLKPCCILCYYITHFIPMFSQMLTICTSTKTQLDIIRLTANYIITHKQIPTINDIDPNATQLKIKPCLFFNNHTDFETTRVFYTKNVDTSYFILNEQPIIEPLTAGLQNYIFEDEYIIPDIHKRRKIETMQRITRWYSKISELNITASQTEKIQYDNMYNKSY